MLVLLAGLAAAMPAQAASRMLLAHAPMPLSGSVAEYAAAMSALRQRTAADLPRGSFIPPGGIPFLWQAANGDTLQRIEEGVFKLISGNCVSSLCTEQKCYAQAWPVFVCDDDRPRTMSAPDADTVIFGDTPFRRARERPQVPDEEGD
ncbi:hypothetical protein ACTDI4_19800 [Mesorhizobium sp. PUT5]|uniref:hypothetical protein n=1 Tax=Mesorhizobium sp. PUT5 TaxID=3454629 RepID=UPI003FA4AFA6